MVWTYHVGTHFKALSFYNESAFFFMSTEVTFQFLNRGHVNIEDYFLTGYRYVIIQVMGIFYNRPV